MEQQDHPELKYIPTGSVFSMENIGGADFTTRTVDHGFEIRTKKTTKLIDMSIHSDILTKEATNTWQQN
jgi:hypothetical protein